MKNYSEWISQNDTPREENLEKTSASLIGKKIVLPSQSLHRGLQIQSTLRWTDKSETKGEIGGD